MTFKLIAKDNGDWYYKNTNIKHRKPMMIMPSNHNSLRMGYWRGKGYNAGWLISQPIAKTNIKDYNDIMPYALDNGRFACWSAGKEWDVGAYMEMLDHCKLLPVKPIWAIVPDVVADKNATLEDWKKWSEIIKSKYRYKLAFAVQDGMTKKDVPIDADVVFVGGSFEWKWRTAQMWCSEFQRVHIARVNTIKRVWKCHDWGAESIDGTGWFRDGANNHRMRVLEDYFQQKRSLQKELNLEL